MNIKTSIEERAVILWGEILRLPDCLSLWSTPLANIGRTLKTQNGFLLRVVEIKDQLNITWKTEDLIKSQCPIEKERYSLGLNLCQDVSKRDTNDQVLKSIVLETLHLLYPVNEWLHIFTDGSRLADGTNAGARDSCNLFSFYTPIGSSITAFDAEVLSVALSQLQNHLEKFNNVVVLSDSSESSLTPICIVLSVLSFFLT
ncbi:uncharacterized protein [Parasteatoda tepidariorum]|uniref:uncharacterized protein n=1 Tax=Parasteatoda tepidariorum TaxID=114398 RepID=UPI0039BCF958